MINIKNLLTGEKASAKIHLTINIKKITKNVEE